MISHLSMFCSPLQRWIGNTTCKLRAPHGQKILHSRKYKHISRVNLAECKSLETITTTRPNIDIKSK